MRRRFKTKGLRVLALFDAGSPVHPDDALTEELKTEDWKTEADVLAALKTLGCETMHHVLHDDLNALRAKLDSFEPAVVFNLADEFRNNRALDQNIASLLELDGVPFTGCGSTGLMLCKHKAISKQILSYHRIRVPDFAVIPLGGRSKSRPARLRFPIILKPMKEEGSTGISKASIVEDDAGFRERVEFLHDRFGQDVIAEEFIPGRELYLAMMGGRSVRVFPVREMVFREMPEDDPKIATYNAKWDEDYRKRWGIHNEFAADLEPALARRIERTGRRIYQLLACDGYARLDLRLTPEGEVVFIEANPNPILAKDEDFADAAAKAGLAYPRLIREILKLGVSSIRG
jgi:D-alanine-D-alanine ligase